MTLALSLAEHKVLVVGLASVSDKERGGGQGSGRSADLLDLGDVVGHGGLVHQDGVGHPTAPVRIAKSM